VSHDIAEVVAEAQKLDLIDAEHSQEMYMGAVDADQLLKLLRNKIASEPTNGEHHKKEQPDKASILKQIDEIGKAMRSA
jgi:hypothetical protein